MIPEDRARPGDRTAVLAFLAAWLAAAIPVARSGALARLEPPGPQLVLLGLTAALLALARLWAPLRRLAATIDVRPLVAVHVTRLVGLQFLALHARGALPWAFAVPGGWGDIAVAVTALALVALVDPARPGGRRLYAAWNLLGLADILGVVATAARLAITVPGSMRALMEGPLALLPTFLVPLIVTTHVVLLARLRASRRRPPPPLSAGA
jgi:hypothetical protein